MQETSLVRYDNLKHALAKCRSIDEVKDIRDKAEALRQYSRQIDDNLEVQNDWAEIVLRAERGAGKLLQDMVRREPSDMILRGNIVLPREELPPTLSDLGISRMQSSRWQTIAKLPEPKFEQHITDIKAHNEELTTAGMLRLAVVLRQQETQLDQAEQTKATPSGAPVVEIANALDWLTWQDPFDLLLTDPPYMTDVPDIAAFAQQWLPLALGKLKPTGRAYICIGAYPQEIAAYLAVAMPEQLLVWTYRNTLGPSPAYNYKQNWQAILYYKGKDAPRLDCPVMLEQFSVQDISAPDGRQGDRYHAWQKPLELAERFIRHATAPGDTVVDPFACTGTFLIAAANLGRIAIGCELSPENASIAETRGCLLSNKT